jgi:ABC-type uncharacterized transport system permease subunit
MYIIGAVVWTQSIVLGLLVFTGVSIAIRYRRVDVLVATIGGALSALLLLEGWVLAAKERDQLAAITMACAALVFVGTVILTLLLRRRRRGQDGGSD